MAFEMKETFKNRAQYIVLVSGYLKPKEKPGREREGRQGGRLSTWSSVVLITSATLIEREA